MGDKQAKRDTAKPSTATKGKAPKTSARTSKPVPETATNETAIELGKRLREIRVRNRLTQPEMAESLNVGRMTYNRYEWGWRLPDAEFCALVVKQYRVDASWLLFGYEAKTEGGSSKTSRLAENYVQVQVYELSKHKGHIRLTSEKAVDEVYVPKQQMAPGTTAVVYNDTNMIPVIMPGAVVGLNLDVEDKPMGHVYAVFIPKRGTGLYRVYMESLKEVSLRSENPALPEIRMSQSDFSKYTLARMVWVFQSTI